MNAIRQSLISPTKRTHIAYLENACVEVSDGALIYKKTEDGEFSDYNIPYANTSMVLLGREVNISRDSIRRLSEHGVMVCLCGNDAKSASETSDSFLAIEPQIEQRTQQYMKQWSSIFLDDARNINAAKMLLKERILFIKKMWEVLPEASDYGLYPEEIQPEITALMKVINDGTITNQSTLHKAAANFEKGVHSFAAPAYGFDGRRQPGSQFDIANRYLDIASYFAYGYASIALHGLAIPFSFSVLHGKSRRCGLIFDIASLIMDGICMPIALEAAMSGRDDDEMCTAIRHAMQEHQVLDYLFKTIKRLCDIC